MVLEVEISSTLDKSKLSSRRFSIDLLVKRLFDIGLSGVGIIGSLPLWGLFALAIKLEDRGPVFYRQERVGIQGVTFNALKFRSMIPDAEKGLGAVQAAEDDSRITKVGKFLRATAMDELPQLWNIFRGDMSFVGPRALRPNELEVKIGNPNKKSMAEITGYRERITVRPGLTGLAQVCLPSDAPRRHKFRYDLVYIKNQSFFFDLKLILLSFYITFRGKWESREKKI
jgi:lipopolysaccharide/colanic/teichoic acid biosynthesis glycosyltransferase